MRRGSGGSWPGRAGPGGGGGGPLGLLAVHGGAEAGASQVRGDDDDALARVDRPADGGGDDCGDGVGQQGGGDVGEGAVGGLEEAEDGVEEGGGHALDLVEDDDGARAVEELPRDAAGDVLAVALDGVGLGGGEGGHLEDELAAQPAIAVGVAVEDGSGDKVSGESLSYS